MLLLGTETRLIERLCSSGYCRGVKSLRLTQCSDGRNVRGQVGMDGGGGDRRLIGMRQESCKKPSLYVST